MRPWKGKAAAEGSQTVTSKPGFGLGPDSKPQARPPGQLVHRSIKATANKCDFSNTLSCCCISWVTSATFPPHWAFHFTDASGFQITASMCYLSDKGISNTWNTGGPISHFFPFPSLPTVVTWLWKAPVWTACSSPACSHWLHTADQTGLTELQN